MVEPLHPNGPGAMGRGSSEYANLGHRVEQPDEPGAHGNMSAAEVIDDQRPINEGNENPDISGERVHRSPLDMAVDSIPSERWTTEPRHPLMINDWTGEAEYKYPGYEAVFGEQVDYANQTVRAVSIEDVVLIDEEIADKILVDEQTHTPMLYEAPYPDAGQGNRDDPETIENNTVWLEHYAEDHLPIPRKRLPDGSWSHDPHDSDEEHLIVNVLAPRELQKEISQAAKIGAKLRRDDPTTLGKGLLLPGEKSNEIDPLNWSGRGAFYRSDIDAINVIDSVTDSKDFVPLMTKLRNLPGAGERTAFMETYAKLAALSRDEAMAQLISMAPGDTERKRVTWAQEEFDMVAHVAANRHMIISIANFNMRHSEERRNLTEDEQQQKVEGYFNGLVRVANKIPQK